MKTFLPITLIAALIPAIASAEVEIPSGTKVQCRLEQTISSGTVEEGQQIQLSVTEDVKIGDTTVIAQGAAVVGTVVMANAKRSMGRTGKLDFSVDKVRAVDGSFIPLRYTINKKEGGSKGVSTGIMTAGVAVVFWPAAPFMLLRKGKDITINKGVVLDVFTDQNHVLKSNMPAPMVSSAALPAAQGMNASNMMADPHKPVAVADAAPVTITSDVNGAEVELDGAFVGSTPMTRQLASGTHRIVVRYGTQVWSRDMQVQGGSPTTANAILKR